MRIRFGVRGLLLMIAVLLVLSYAGYKDYYWNYKTLAELHLEPTATDFFLMECRFVSKNIPEAKLTVVWDHGLHSERSYEFPLLANKKYQLHFHDMPQARISIQQTDQPDNLLEIPAVPPHIDFEGSNHFPLGQVFQFGRGQFQAVIGKVYFNQPDLPLRKTIPGKESRGVLLYVTVKE
jgi:hypothetical protein